MSLFLSLFKSSFLAITGLTSLTSASGWYIYNNLKFSPKIENNYISRIRLNSENNSVNIRNKTYDFSNLEQKKKLLEEDRQRLSLFYRKYSSQNTSVNTSESSDFFVHLRTNEPQKNLNRLWIDNVHLNQLSIDRYGYTYDSNTGIKSSSTASLVNLVKWRNIDIEGARFESLSKNRLANISFNFFNEDIPKSEVDIITNEEESKFKTDDYTSKDWFVWLDKDLLILKLNYFVKSYVFNQVNARSQASIIEVIGSKENPNKQEDQKKKSELVNSDFESLTDIEKNFARDYISVFINNSVDLASDIDWIKVVSEITASDLFITSDKVNKIYNKFSKDNKDLTIFKEHLLTKITSGRVGNWKISLDLSKDKSKPPVVTGNFESRLIEKSVNDKLDNSKNRIRIYVDPDTNTNLKLGKIYDLITRYSSKYFSLNIPISGGLENFYISSNYSSASNAKSIESMQVTSLEVKNEFSFI